MTDPGNTADAAQKMQAIKAEFVRVLSERIRSLSDDPRQMRDMVYELARIKLLEQFTHADARESRQVQEILERAIREVERSFERSSASSSAPSAASGVVAAAQPADIGTHPPALPKAGGEARRPVPPPVRSETPRRSSAFRSVARLAAIVLVIAIVGAAVAYWPRMKAEFIALLRRPTTVAEPQAAPPPRESEATERPLPTQTETPLQPAPPSLPLPTTFGVYALSDGQLQELKALPGKVPDRRVAISAAITTPSATTLTSGDIKFIVFRPDSAVDASGTEVRVIAKVARSMGVDPSGKASMVNAGDSWVIRSASFPYKVGPVEDQPRMLLLQPENDGFALPPGRYVVVVKGLGYDFTVAGDVTAPDQCVERINAANGAFYSPCPPKR